jgi:hypothetical protein
MEKQPRLLAPQPVLGHSSGGWCITTLSFGFISNSTASYSNASACQRPRRHPQVARDRLDCAWQCMACCTAAIRGISAGGISRRASSDAPTHSTSCPSLPTTVPSHRVHTAWRDTAGTVSMSAWHAAAGLDAESCMRMQGKGGRARAAAGGSPYSGISRQPSFRRWEANVSGWRSSSCT